ncbi:alpha/beta-hydrolase [Xylariaceae sp. FL0255]|nr:alpha/beta-hydrolase [Xylariaceae sp. FL0255]
MSPRPYQWAIPLGISLGLPLGVYVTFIVLGSVPFFQRHFLYAHRINTLFWHDLNQPEYWGFARNQVTPFSLTSPDGGSIYSWHILPLQTYLKHEERLQSGPGGFSNDITASESFRIFKDDPNARLVVSFHGNAGHIAQGMRTDHFHALTDTSNFHVLTIDYRGFGKSTGHPSETGLIQDGVTAIDWAMNVAGIPPSRIVIIGQSLGTAVTSGVAEYYARKGVEFAGIILIAGFSNVPALLSGYHGGGFIPVLSPFRRIPPLLRFFQSFVVDKWESANRLADVVRLTKNRLRLTLIHAKDDAEIPCYESDALFKSAAQTMIEDSLDDKAFSLWKKQRSIFRDDGTFITVAQADTNVVIRQELVPYGGHNNVMISSVITLAVMRSFASDVGDLL